MINILEGFNTDNILPTLNLVSASDDPSEEQEVNDFEEVNASVLTSKIESIQRLINNARVKAGVAIFGSGECDTYLPQTSQLSMKWDIT